MPGSWTVDDKKSATTFQSHGRLMKEVFGRLTEKSLRQHFRVLAGRWKKSATTIPDSFSKSECLTFSGASWLHRCSSPFSPWFKVGGGACAHKSGPQKQRPQQKKTDTDGPPQKSYERKKTSMDQHRASQAGRGSTFNIGDRSTLNMGDQGGGCDGETAACAEQAEK